MRLMQAGKFLWRETDITLVGTKEKESGRNRERPLNSSHNGKE